MYGRAKTWTCQSLAKDVCKEQMPRCKFLSEMSEAVKAFLQKNTEQMHPEVGVYLQMEDWNNDDAHPNYVEMSTRRTLCFILQVLNLWIMCASYMVQLYLTSFSSVQTQGRCPPFFPFHMVLAGGSRPAGPTPPVPSRDARRRPCTAELLQGAKRTLVRITRTRLSMNNLAALLRERGKLAEAGLRSSGWEVTFLEGVSPRAFFCLAKAWGLDLFFSISRYYWVTFFERTNTN